MFLIQIRSWFFSLNLSRSKGHAKSLRQSKVFGANVFKASPQLITAGDVLLMRIEDSEKAHVMRKTTVHFPISYFTAPSALILNTARTLRGSVLMSHFLCDNLTPVLMVPGSAFEVLPRFMVPLASGESLWEIVFIFADLIYIVEQ